MDIYDIVINFSSTEYFLDFFEWRKEDELFYIDKIKAFKVNSKVLNDIINYKIKTNKEFLKQIENTTITDKGVIKYACLVGDNNKIYALEFLASGYVLHVSSLLLDEEEAVIEEMSNFELYSFDYQVLARKEELFFLTRKEKLIRNYLIDKINVLYENKNYDEINYLYFEMFNDKDTFQSMYRKLIDDLTNNFSDSYFKLYEIVKIV